MSLTSEGSVSPQTPTTPQSPFAESPLGQKLTQLLSEQAVCSPDHLPDLSWLVFKRYKDEGEGSLSPRNFDSMVKDLGYELSERQMSLALSLIDENADGVIQYHEFYRVWRSSQRFKSLQFTTTEEEVLERSMKYFQFFDTNDDGIVDSNEFHDLHASLVREGFTGQSKEELFKEVDIGGDGALSFSEFANWLQNKGSVNIRALSYH